MEHKFEVGQIVDVTDNGNYGGYSKISDKGVIIDTVNFADYQILEVELIQEYPEHVAKVSRAFYSHELKLIEEPSEPEEKLDNTKCPSCERDTIEGSFITVEEDKAIQEMFCNHCDHSWEDVYKFSGRN